MEPRFDRPSPPSIHTMTILWLQHSVPHLVSQPKVSCVEYFVMIDTSSHLILLLLSFCFLHRIDST